MSNIAAVPAMIVLSAMLTGSLVYCCLSNQLQLATSTYTTYCCYICCSMQVLEVQVVLVLLLNKSAPGLLPIRRISSLLLISTPRARSTGGAEETAELLNPG